MIDPGAFDNLVGSEWVERLMTILKKYHLQPNFRKLEQPISCEGVGNGSSSSNVAACFPGTVIDQSGVAHPVTYDAPILPNSHVPALWGHRSLKRQRAVIDVVNQVLHLCGPGDIQFTPPPGSWSLKLTMSKSGHLLLPFTEFEEWARQDAVKQVREEAAKAFSAKSPSASTDKSVHWGDVEYKEDDAVDEQEGTASSSTSLLTREISTQTDRDKGSAEAWSEEGQKKKTRGGKRWRANASASQAS